MHLFRHPITSLIATKLVCCFAFVPSELRLLVPVLTHSDYTSASTAHIFTCSELKLLYYG